MFGINKKTVRDIGQMETIIGLDTVFKGTISGKGTIRIDGQFEGDINTLGNLMVGENAIIKAQIAALNATIAGTIYGDIDVSEKLELLPSARMYGDIKVGVLTISEGATFKGSCEMRKDAEQPIMEGKSASILPCDSNRKIVSAKN